MNLYSLKHRIVRDLAWAVCTPPLFSAVSGFSPECFSRDYITIDQELCHWLQALDSRPAPLIEHISQQRSSRLGIYFEQLLSFYFGEYPRFDLLAKNYQVHEQGRTLGEFDFIVYDRWQDAIYHIETALKFYLGYPGCLPVIPKNYALHNWHHWIGPNQKDSLAIKMQHLHGHQLVLGANAAGAQALLKLVNGPRQISSRLLLLGRFYFPFTGNVDAPCFADCTETLKRKHRWFSYDDFLQQASEHQSHKHYCLLPRPYWLSELTKEDLATADLLVLTMEELVTQLEQEKEQAYKEWQVAVIDPDAGPTTVDVETERFFIIRTNVPSP